MKMNNEGGTRDVLHSLVPLTDFKAILGIDDREDALSRYCLITATFTIEQYCMRRLVKKIINERLTMSNGDLLLPLREYPVRKILGVWGAESEEGGVRADGLVNPDNYFWLPDEGVLVLRPLLRFSRGEMGIRVRYAAGYAPGRAPADLASACLELAAWNMARYRGKRIGMTGKEEQFDASMPENVRFLLGPYRRKTI